ncbi:MAG: hypothetical protein IJE01_02075 [Clostridia bacterium]|nr:hypothetical protein [Clostridia bacterium]
MFRNFLQNLTYKLQSFMYGRYGMDDFSRFLTWVALAFFIINLFINSIILYFLGLFALIFSTYRCYSKNIYKRQKERATYVKYKNKLLGWFRIRKRIYNERKVNKYFKCPTCKAYLHVPKGRGKIIITCPKCKNEITRKS